MIPHRFRRAGALPPAALYGIIGVAVVGIGLVLYLGFGRSGGGGAGGTAAGLLIRKCSACNATAEDKRDTAVSQGWLDPEGIRLFGQGAKCPKCGKDTMVLAEKCPKDGTIYIPKFAADGAGGPQGCPKCGMPARTP